MAQKKVTLTIMAMTDERTRQKAMGVVAGIQGVDFIGADLKDQKLTIIGQMDPIDIAKKLKKVGKTDILSVGSAN